MAKTPANEQIGELEFLRQFQISLADFLFLRDINAKSLGLPQKMAYKDWVEAVCDYFEGHGFTNPEND